MNRNAGIGSATSALLRACAEGLRPALAGTAIIVLLFSAGCATVGGGSWKAHSDGSIGSSNPGAGNEHVIIRPNSGAPDQDGLPPSGDIPPDLINAPDAVPRPEARSAFGNPTSYEVYGQKYVVLNDARGFKENGQASWYGKKFHGKLTSSGEPYDMFKMTAAHKTLPIPCYARVTNLTNHKSVVVRINDRGPFHSGRIIDLSYVAALRLGLIGDGSAPVELEVLTPASGPTLPPILTASGAPREDRVATVAPVTASVGPTPPTLRVPGQMPAAAPETGLQMAMAINPGTSTVRGATPDRAGPAPDRAARPPPASSAPPGLASRELPAAPENHPAAAVPVSMQPSTGTVMPVPPPPRWLQAGLFGDASNAASLREELLRLGIENVQLKSEVRGESYIHRVLVGPYADQALIEIMREHLAELHLESIPVAE